MPRVRDMTANVNNHPKHCRSITGTWLLCLVAVMPALLGCNGTGPHAPRGYEIVPLFKIIADPKNYNDQLIEVSGYLGRNPSEVFGSSAVFLYLSEDHARLYDFSSSIEVSVINLDSPPFLSASSDLWNPGDSPCIGRFVTLRGRFELYQSRFPMIVDLEAVITSVSPELEFCWQLSQDD